MTVVPARYCPVQRCHNRTDGGRCTEHAVVQEHSRPNYTWRRLYRRAPWQHLRRSVLADEPFCSDCAAKGETSGSTDVHHKTRPLNETQFYDRANLMALCAQCHAIRTGRGE
jgi:5-methylcytosine-specific restriction endonuclease McrA